MAYFDWEINNAFHREDHFLAQIAVEVRRTLNPKKAKDVKIKPFLLKFKAPQVKEEEDEVEITPDERMARSKSFWGALTGAVQRPGQKLPKLVTRIPPPKKD